MSNQTSVIVFNNIKLPFDASVKEAFSVAMRKLRALGLNPGDSKPYVYKRSIDARNKNSISVVVRMGTPCEEASTVYSQCDGRTPGSKLTIAR